MAKSKAKPVKKAPVKNDKKPQAKVPVKHASKPASKPSAKTVAKKPVKTNLKPAVKAAAKKPVKPIVKAKAAIAHKKPQKPDVKPASKSAPKKPVAPAPVKKADVKAPLKAPAPKNEVKKATEIVKKDVSKVEVKDLKKPLKVEETVKKDNKAVQAKKIIRPVKNDDDVLDDDFIADGLGGSEIEEYEEELAIVEEMDAEEVETSDDLSMDPKDRESDEIILTDAEGNRYCRARDCDQIAKVDAYCRYHYLLYWRKIQNRKKILAGGKLEKYIEELTARYPDKFLEMIRRDLRTEKDFSSAIQEMEIDESATDSDFEAEAGSFQDEVRGIGESAGSGVDDDDF